MKNREITWVKYVKKMPDIWAYYMQIDEYTVCVHAKNSAEVLKIFAQNPTLNAIICNDIRWLGYNMDVVEMFNLGCKKEETIAMQKRIAEYEERALARAAKNGTTANLICYSFIEREDIEKDLVEDSCSSDEYYTRGRRDIVPDLSEEEMFPERVDPVDIEVQVAMIPSLVENLRQKDEMYDDDDYWPSGENTQEELSDILKDKSLSHLECPEEIVEIEGDDIQISDGPEVGINEYREEMITSYLLEEKYADGNKRMNVGELLSSYLRELNEKKRNVPWPQYYVIYEFARYVSYNGYDDVYYVKSDLLREYPAKKVKLKKLFDDWVVYNVLVFDGKDGFHYTEKDLCFFSNVSRLLEKYYDGRYYKMLRFKYKKYLKSVGHLYLHEHEIGKFLELPAAKQKYKNLYRKGVFKEIECSSIASYHLLSQCYGNVQIEPNVLFTSRIFLEMDKIEAEGFSYDDFWDVVREEAQGLEILGKPLSLFVFDLEEDEKLFYEC